MRYIRPLPLKPSYYSHIEAQINEIFAKLIYDPLRKVLKHHNLALRNATDPIADGIDSEKIFFHEGAFYGKFNSRISKALRELGAIYDGRKKAWILPMYKLPPQIQHAIIQAELRFQILKNDVLNAISTINPREIKPVNYLPTIESVQADLARTLASVAVPTVMSPRTKRIIAREWAENLDLYIKNWAGENIIKLRTQVQANALAGGRAEGLLDVLQHNYGTSKSKAKFLARQETSLLVSKLRENEYKEAGITRYKWSVAGGDEPDERVRELHKLLNGRIFSFDNPPASGTNGERLNPGEPFGCRCLAIPIVE